MLPPTPRQKLQTQERPLFPAASPKPSAGLAVPDVSSRAPTDAPFWVALDVHKPSIAAAVLPRIDVNSNRRFVGGSTGLRQRHRAKTPPDAMTPQTPSTISV
jgi:hypothetical protein